MLNGDTRELCADGREVPLSPKALALLLLLVGQRARALSKRELEDQLWPSTFIGETNLATLVAEIRRALGDAAHRSEYVRTVHRFGYRFVADVVETAAPSMSIQTGRRMYLTAGDRQFTLTEGAMVIGRGADAAIRIESGGVSRHHARILVNGGEARVEDLGSKNGTFVKGERIASGCLLQDGDEIRVGPVAVVFSLAAETGATETMK